MRISTLLTLVAVLAGGLTFATPGFAQPSATQQQACHLAPVADSVQALKPEHSVGVLYSENTVSTLAYLERYHATASSGAKNSKLDSRIRDAFINSSDPKLAIDWLQGSLKKEFSSVTVYENLDALMKARPDVVVMLDTYNRLVTQRNTQVQARFIATFYDANLQFIGKAEGLGQQELSSIWVRDKAAPEIAAQINQQRDLQINALKQFDASLKVLVGPGQKGEVASN